VKRTVLGLAVLFVGLSFCTESQAFRLFRRRSTNTNVSSVQLSGSDQQRCQQKANIMASRHRMSHGVAALVGAFEGIGTGGSRNCGTCTPRRGMKLTGDGAAQSSNGTWYRCRSWR